MQFETVDPSPKSVSFGATSHYVSNFEDLSDRKEMQGKFDLLILNGVLNYGIDTRMQKHGAMNAAAQLLRSSGMLLVGFRDSSTFNDFVAEDMPEDLFRPGTIPGLDCHYYLTGSSNKHAFKCFEKISA